MAEAAWVKPQIALAEAITAAKLGQRQLARKLLAELVERDPNNESAWLWIAALSEVFTSDVAESLHTRGEAFRASLNEVFASAGVAMRFSGCGSLMNLHALPEPPTRVADLTASDDRFKELLFLDLLERGYYVARRGFIALSLALTPAQLDDFVAAVAEVVALRQTLLPRS